MASLTLKNVPDDLLGAVRATAEADRRSLNQQIIHLIEVALEERIEKPARAPEIEAQLASWRRLARRWQSDLGPAAEARELTKRRTRGRKVDL